MGLSFFLSWVPAGPLLAAAWVLAAWGYGRLLRAALFPGMSAGDAMRGPAEPAPGAREALSIGLGMAFLLAIESLLGSAGAFRTGLGWRLLAWTVILVGAGAGLVRRRKGSPSDGGIRPWRLTWPAAAALAVLLTAVTLPPGLAWATEFGGYDALSYHLQLPKEWLEAGRVQPLRHSVYSAFPSFVETATLHLWTLASFAPVHDVAEAAQWLHAAIAVAAAIVTGALAAAMLPPTASDRARAWSTAIGTVGALGIPWVTVTGSLAYNDMAPVLFLATAMLAWAAGGASHAGRSGLAVGMALGAAAGSKLTALGMVAVPFVAWALVAAAPGTRRALGRGAMFAAPVALMVLLPWMTRNWMTIGTPLFPFAGDAPGWWTAEQIGRFAAGHAAAPGIGPGGRFEALWDQGFREGFGAAPDADPWLPQWGVAFGAGVAAIAATSVRMPRAGLALAAALLAQLGFWMLATHLKARFLLPCAVPLCAAMGVAIAPRAAAVSRGAGRATGVALGAMLVAWSMQPLIVLRSDARMSGTDGVLAMRGTLGPAIRLLGPGTRTDADALAAAGDPMPLAWWANWRMPKDARLGCEGEADVFWCTTTPRWGTVWDGGPLARALRAHPRDPRAAIDAMRAEGITHLAIGEATLARWRAAGWLDPALAPADVRAVASKLTPVAPLASGGTVYELPPASP